MALWVRPESPLAGIFPSSHIHSISLPRMLRSLSHRPKAVRHSRPVSIELSQEDELAMKFLKEEESLWKNTKKIDTLFGRAEEFDAIFFVGGHGRKYMFGLSLLVVLV